jgi:hypothetical protein
LTWKSLSLQPCLVNGEDIAIAENHRTLDDILQLSNVSRPVIRLKQLECTLGYARKLLARFFAVAIDQVLKEQRNVTLAFAERRN